jgi:transposase InsO family protein
MSPGDTVSSRLDIRAEFERMANGRWVATIPGVPETMIVGYGWSQHEAAVGLTVRALHIMADRFQRGELEVKDEPAGIIVLADSLSAMLTELADSHTPNAETIAAIEESGKWRRREMGCVSIQPKLQKAQTRRTR